MNLWNNLKIRRKIMANNVLVLLLAALVGGLALARLSQINTTVTHLADVLVEQQHVADKIAAEISLMRFYTNQMRVNSLLKVVSNTSPSREFETETYYQNTLKELESDLSLAGELFDDPAQRELLSALNTEKENYIEDFSSVSGLMNVEFKSAQIKADAGLAQLRDTAVAAADSSTLYYVGGAQATLATMRENLILYIMTGYDGYWDRFERDYGPLNTTLEQLIRMAQDPEVNKVAKDVRTSVINYYNDAVRFRTNFMVLNATYTTILYETGPAVQDKADNISVKVREAVATEKEASKKLFIQTQIWLVVVVMVAIILGIALGWFIANGITKPLNAVVDISRRVTDVEMVNLVAEMTALAQGDLRRNLTITTPPLAITSTDEVGQTALAFNNIIARLHEVGMVFNETTVNLRNLVERVSVTAQGAGQAAEHLLVIAGQTERATVQVGEVIQQMAQGAVQQTEGVARAVGIVEQVSQAIDGVAQGAQEQAAATAETSTITARIVSVVDAVSKNAQSGATDAAKAAQNATIGAEVIEKTIRGMENIKTRVGVSAERVREMGSRSGQIESIVETIDDIASQTNLLALNAAIEAARAGEHGKGFAVVADEVRKLAEKSALATREISSLVKDIQQTTAAAVKAMDEGAQEVETGVASAAQAKQALTDILHNVQTVSGQMAEISVTVGQAGGASFALTDAMERVSAVVEENTAATEEMAAGSAEVMTSIEEVANISRENSAAAQEVNAAAEEMSAQAQMVNISAQSVKEMADQLTSLVRAFKLNAADGDMAVAPGYRDKIVAPAPVSAETAGPGAFQTGLAAARLLGTRLGKRLAAGAKNIIPLAADWIRRIRGAK